jgi:O-succinylbenzoate synthase
MLKFFEYELPFRSTFKTGSSEYKSRKGILFYYRENDDEFMVEASPLPGFSRETLAEVKQALHNQKKWIEGYLKGELSFQTIRSLVDVKELNLPSIQFSLSFLSLSVLANRQNKSFYDLFGQKNPDKVPINDVIGHSPIQQMKHQIEQSIQKGFQVLKIKAPHPIDKLVTLLNDVHKEHPHVKFRIDANQSWPKSEVDRSCRLLQYLPIEYIEEPCRMDGLGDIEEIKKISGLPIALDESIPTIKQLKKVLKQFPDLFVILKPMALGNFLEIHETISQFRSSCKQIVVTTMLESRMGRSMIASTASLIGDSQMRHGLHTGHLFTDDLLPDFEIENGSIINLPKNPAIISFSDTKTSFLKHMG